MDRIICLKGMITRPYVLHVFHDVLLSFFHKKFSVVFVTDMLDVHFHMGGTVTPFYTVR